MRSSKYAGMKYIVFGSGVNNHKRSFVSQCKVAYRTRSKQR